MINGIRLRCELPWYEEGIESNTLYIILIYIYIYIYIYHGFYSTSSDIL